MRYLAIIAYLGAALTAHARVIYVDNGASGTGDGTSWPDALTTLSVAVERASAGDEIWVAEGTYAGPIELKNGVALNGGFSGVESNAADSDPDAHRTLITGATQTRALVGSGLDSTTIVRGFRITDGMIEFPETGGGVYLKNSDVMFVQCVFANNTAKTFGGGVAIWGGSPTFVNCRFTHNSGGLGAGAVFSRREATPSFVNCLFDGNEAYESGAVAFISGHGTFTNCTLVKNGATKGRGGALYDTRGESVVRNCILWGNTSAIAGTSAIYNHYQIERKSSVADSLVGGSWAGEGNLDTDPLFVDAANGDYRLRSDSPCRNGGSNAHLPADLADLSNDGNKTETLPRDIALHARVEGSSVDMGAFEWHP